MNRDEAATEVIQTVQTIARNYAITYRLPPEDADDLTQIALLEILAGWKNFDPERSSWRTYAINLALWGIDRELLHRNKEPKTRALVEEKHADTRTADAITACEYAETLELIAEHINAHTGGENYRKAAELVFFGGVTQSEAARILGISTSRVSQIALKVKSEIRKTANRND